MLFFLRCLSICPDYNLIVFQGQAQHQQNGQFYYFYFSSNLNLYLNKQLSQLRGFHASTWILEEEKSKPHAI